ncbi:hypothetical protein [Streptomyces sp. NPDC014676]|uniref:hypothetical protein n=1 Tax=Streptomyces sp. NPDC014676 TaxID=3364879 RepID=UPI003700D4CB
MSKPEVDLVGADRSPAREIGFVGSVKWHEHGSFGRRALVSDRGGFVPLPRHHEPAHPDPFRSWPDDR